MSNIYLERKREQAEAIKSTIDGLQTRAADENRDLSEDELRSIKEQSDTYKTLVSEIESITDVETRARKVASLAASLADDDGDETRSLGTSNTTARDRDPGHYRSVREGGEYSFFGDLYRARVNSDDAAAQRLVEHNRALSTGNQGVGIVPPKWLTEEFETIARQGRRLPVREIPLGDDPRPMTLGKQTAGADSTNPAEQANENDPTPGADKFDSDVDTVVPKPTTGKQTVSRQMLDMSNPAVDQLVYADMLEEFNDQVEAKVGAGLIAAAGAAVTTFATEAEFATAGDALDSVIDLGIAVRNARKRPADVLAMAVTRYGRFLKLRDTEGRPLIANANQGQAVNVAGVGSVQTDGIIEGLAVAASDGIPFTSTDAYLAYRAADQLLFLSNVLRFRFEEVAGPESVVLGVWGYTAFLSRQAGKSVKRAVVTANS